MKRFTSEHRNIKIAYILVFLGEFYFPVTVWLFFYLRFLDFTQVALITAIQVIVTIIFEVPTGAFADTVGRKISVFLSFLIYAAAMFGTIFASVFWMFAALEVLKGLSIALLSGSLEALVYDTLKEKGEEHRYDKVNSNMRSLEWLALFLSAILGGVAFTISPNIPYIVQTILYVAAAVFCFKLVEPKLDSVKYSAKSFFKQNLHGFKELFGNRQIAQLTLVLVTISFGFFVTADFLGLAQARDYGLDSAGVGVLFGVSYVLAALASQSIIKLKSKLNNYHLVALSGVILVGSLVLANFVGIAIGSLLIVGRIITSSVFNNVRYSVVNAALTSANRATALSTLSLLFKVPYALMVYFMGSLIDQTSPNYFALVLGSILLVLILPQVALLFRRKDF